MNPFAQKKGRTAKIPVRSGSTLLHIVRQVLTDRVAATRLLLGMLAVFALVISVQGWKPAFPYRLGQKPLHGIAASIEFERENPFATDRARELKAAQVPHIFRHDESPLNSLPVRLRNELRQLSAFATLETVSEELKNSFGLSPSSKQQVGSSQFVLSFTERFNRLREAAKEEQQLNQLIAEFGNFLDGVRRTGFLVSPIPAEAEISPNDTLEIVSADGHRERVLQSELRVPDLLSPTGLLGESWKKFPTIQPLRPMLENWITLYATDTLSYDASATEEMRQAARDSVPTATNLFPKGTLIVQPGQSIDQEHLALLMAEYDAVQRAQEGALGRIKWLGNRTLRLLTVSLLILVLAGFNAYYLYYNEQQLFRSVSRLSIYLTAIVLTIALGRFLSQDPWRAEVIPLLFTSMIIAIAYNQVLAAITGFSLSLLLTMSSVDNVSHFVILISSATTAVIPLKQVSSRSKLIIVGFWTGLIFVLTTIGTEITAAQSLTAVFRDEHLLVKTVRGFAWCLASGFLVAGSLPFIELAFGVVTEISLLEMSDISHPLLQELVRRAPGTYNHSITVATIAEAAAETIGANGTLVRVGAYFHDIGKMLKPHYFVENMQMGEESRHGQLNPAMSTLIIIGHVKDGVDLAEQHGLPQKLIDFIEQHHGTTLVEYFFREATRQAEGSPDQADVMESSFRYPGPKPQTKEAGVLMLADIVEGASRTLSEPTPKRIERLVHDLTMKRLQDGQFEESSLTMHDLHMIELSLIKSLLAIYHGRIKYPEQRTA